MEVALLDVRNVPEIAKDLTSETAMEAVIPQGSFSDIIRITHEDAAISINMIQGESHNNVVKIPSKIYNPTTNGVVFPRFILQISTLFNHAIDYSADYSHLILNQNQLLYLVIHHRLTILKKNKIQYADLLKKDIARISNFGEYATYSTYNSQKKSENSFILLNVFQPSHKSDGFEFRTGYEGRIIPMGEMLDIHNFNKNDLNKIFRDLPVQPASEGMASESNKFVFSNHAMPFYKAPGFGLFKAKSQKLMKQQQQEIQEAYNLGMPAPHKGEANGEFYLLKSIFDTSKPNIPARFKSHITSDAYRFPNPSAPIFKEDIQNFELMETDGTKMDAFVIFTEIDPETNRYTCGEAEVSKTFASKLVVKDEIIKSVFKTLLIKVGDEFSGDGAKHCILGTDEDDKNIALSGFKHIKIVSIEESGLNSSYKIVATCKRQIGAARIYSATGLKAMTKPMQSLGKAVITLPNGHKRSLNVDIVTGMNAVKGKQNTIMLAKAALMYRMGCVGPLAYLDTMNEQQINDAANLFDRVEWTDAEGVVRQALGGIVQISVNELAYMFNNVKYQSFMAESGRYLAQGGKEELFKYIWENNIDPDDKEVIKELKKILTDNIGYYAGSDKLDVFSVDGIRKLEIFEKEDLKFEKKPVFPHKTKFMDESYNTGFYLDLRYRDGGMVRFPSGKLLNHFTARTPSGDWIYPQLLINKSNCLQCCLVPNNVGKFDIGFLNSRDPNRKGRVDHYLNQVEKVLFKEQNFASRLVKPRMLGVNMKQMVDCYVPRGTVVVFDSRVYSELAKEAGYEWYIDSEGKTSIPHFLAMCIRNPVIWKSQLQTMKVWSKEHFRYHLASKGINMDDRFVVRFCKELLMMNPFDALIQQSDVDGDIMPVFVPKGIRGQELLEETFAVEGSTIRGVNGIVPQEMEWIGNYIQGEHDNSALKAEKYQLYKIPYSWAENEGSPTYSSYFADSIIAKGDVGLATHHNWALQTLLEIGFQCAEKGIIKDQYGKPLAVSLAQIQMMTYAYSRMVQDFVVRGIKHVAGGSNEFKPFLLNNMASPEYVEHVIKVLTDTVGLERAIVDKFLTIVNWGVETKITESIMKFISLHNKGSVPVEYNESHFNYIVDNTFYGSLVKPLYEIEREIAHARQDRYSYQGTIDPTRMRRKPTEFEALMGQYKRPVDTQMDGDEAVPRTYSRSRAVQMCM